MNVSVLSTASRKAGGLFYSVRWLSKALAQQGCSPMLFSPEDSFSKEDRHEWDPIPVKFYSTVGPMQTSFQLRRMLADAGPDLIHLHGIWMDNQWASLHHQKKGAVPVVISPRGMLDPWALRNSAWKKRGVEWLFVKKSLRTAACIHALSRSEAESIRAYGLKTPIALIPNGVELPEMRDPQATVGDQKIVLFLGRVHPKKGLSELLEAFKSFSAGWKLIVAGWDDGGHEAGLRALAGERVEFVGPQYGAKKEQLFRRADAFILPSFSEGLPMSVLEAWSYGLPVVMTPFCNLPEGFAAAAAFEVQPRSDSILHGLEQLAALSDAGRVDMGLRGRRLVEEKFAWPSIAEHMQQVYSWCISNGDVPECIEFFE